METRSNGAHFSRRKVLIGGCASAVALSSNSVLTPMGAKANSTKAKIVKFDKDRFVEDCVAASKEDDSVLAVNEVLGKAVSDHQAILKSLGEPKVAGLDVMLSSPTLTIFAAKWTPQMNLMPHDHLMWAQIGIYTGREDNILWQRKGNDIEASSATCLFQGDTAILPADVIHSVSNPLLRFTGGIHIYGGDFFGTHRHQWDPETLKEGPSDGKIIREMFARENERLGLKVEN